MNSALALQPTAAPPPLRPAPHLSLVRPRPPARDLRAAYVFSTFFDWLGLSESHARAFGKRFGWSPETSLCLGIRSAPSHVEKLVLLSELKQLVGDSDAWPPGFYTEGDALRLDCETRFGLILQVWRRVPVALQFYSHLDALPRWITSSAHPTGSAVTASIHAHAMMQDAAEVKRVFVVDHTLHALAVAVRHRVSTVGLNGVAVGSVPAQLFESFPSLRGVVLALAEPHPRLERELTDAGLSVREWEGGELL